MIHIGKIIVPNSFISEEVKRRFLSNIEKTSSCWIWKGSLRKTVYSKLVYGQFYLGNHKETNRPLTIGAHRFSYWLHKGSLEKGKVIAHTCHNPRCVNPDHLKQVTHSENTQMSVKDGRMHKLTKERMC